MWSPIEGTHNQLKSRQNLPRGYFKKRKPDCSIPLANATFSTMLFAAILITLVTAGSVNSLATTIEPDLAVLSLEKPATSNTTGLHEKGVNNTNGSE